jgi:hypothetical protein
LGHSTECLKGAHWGLKRSNLIISKNTFIGALFVVITVLILQITNPQPAVPVVYKERPPLMQVSAKQVAKELLNKEQYSCFTKLIGKESAWNPKAQNPISTASGIGQMLDSTVSSLGMKKSNAGVAQLVATLSYISRRHSHPCGAWNHFKEKGWY